jgi:cation diffusion facilitator CzcD-associated flavoprotein CzcO
MNPSTNTIGKFCIVGAGPSGLAVAKNFRSLGIEFDCFEREDDVGGNWYYGKPHSRVYRSTRLISSKRETEYTDFAMPDAWPEQPGHELVWQYLRNYAQQFDLYRCIQFDTSVVWIEPTPGTRVGEGENGRGENKRGSINVRVYPSAPLPIFPSTSWDVTLSDGTLRRYHGVVIANGHNWDPRWPDYPGQFLGTELHSAQYKTPEICDGKRVLVVGGGNSGFDIAVDVAPWAAATYHSLRRGYHLLPRYFRGVPIDQCGQWALRWRLPLWLRRFAAVRAARIAWGERALSCLPRPDHRLFETHPAINSRWPYEVSRGAIRVKPDIRQLDGGDVVFLDGSREAIDLVVYATGYNLAFPFIDQEHMNWRNDRPEMYLNIFHPDRDDLFIAGLIQPDSGQFGLADYQAQLIAAYIRAMEEGRPAARRFQAEKRRNASEALGGGIRYVHSPRHLVEVEHSSYRRRLQRWIARLRAEPARRAGSKRQFHSVGTQLDAIEDTPGGC